tara:strand:- start:981 stop:1193 length:213 start_codon:yes stop_codon:yes gene_type:complete
MRDVLKIGDLVKHTTILGKLNRGYGIIVDLLSVEYDKINTVKCAWYSGESSWVHKGQLELIARGQNGEKN